MCIRVSNQLLWDSHTQSRVTERRVPAQVALQLSQKDVIRAHARDELGIDLDDMSNPWKAAAASAVAFVIGAGAWSGVHAPCRRSSFA